MTDPNTTSHLQSAGDVPEWVKRKFDDLQSQISELRSIIQNQSQEYNISNFSSQPMVQPDPPPDLNDPSIPKIQAPPSSNMPIVASPVPNEVDLSKKRKRSWKKEQFPKKYDGKYFCADCQKNNFKRLCKCGRDCWRWCGKCECYASKHHFPCRLKKGAESPPSEDEHETPQQQQQSMFPPLASVDMGLGPPEGVMIQSLNDQMNHQHQQQVLVHQRVQQVQQNLQNRMANNMILSPDSVLVGQPIPIPLDGSGHEDYEPAKKKRKVDLS